MNTTGLGAAGYSNPEVSAGFLKRMKIIPYIYSLSNVIFEVERCSISNSDAYANDDTEIEGMKRLKRTKKKSLYLV